MTPTTTPTDRRRWMEILQGGVFGVGEAQAFAQRPFAQDAIRLRLANRGQTTCSV